MDLTELSVTLGYSSHSHFTAAFRRHYGIPPSLLRAVGKASFR
jgi:AraC family transcriptional regulator